VILKESVHHHATLHGQRLVRRQIAVTECRNESLRGFQYGRVGGEAAGRETSGQDAIRGGPSRVEGFCHCAKHRF